MRYVLKVAYDGTDFCGWQLQKNGRSVQAELNRALFSAFGEKVCVVASGRTDAGVHALAQICHVDLLRDIQGAKIADALNFYLPADVSVLNSAVAEEGFDSNRSAKRKTYAYSLYCTRPNPLLERYAVRLKNAPDMDKMRAAAEMFVGEHDFSAYCAAGSQVRTTVRTVYSFDITRDGGRIVCRVCGNGFLYNMVRTLVGTVLWYAFDKLSREDIVRSLTDGDRASVGKTMPAKGLVLESVEYGFKLFDE